MTIKEDRDNIIKDFENQINKRINKDYNTFGIFQYDNGQRLKYGVIFNGHQIALCRDLSALENVIKALAFLLDGGHKNEL